MSSAEARSASTNNDQALGNFPQEITAMKSHYPVLDGLRGTAAFSVFLFHFCEMLVPDLAHNPMPHTFLAVDFFFALSGFVLGHAYDARLARDAGAREKLTLWGYFKRRLIRLHPMVVAAMVIALIAYLADPFVGDSQRIGVKLPWSLLATAFLLNLLLLPTPTLPNTFGETHSVDGPSWTLLQEYIANLLYGLFGRKLTLGIHILLCVASAVALTLTAVHFGDLGHGWGWSDFWVAPVRLVCPFLLGLLVSRSKLSWAVPHPFIILSLVLLAVFFAPIMGRLNGLFEAACVIILFPAVLAGGTGADTMRGWQGRICRFAGNLSYPLYIIHYPFIYLFAHWNWSTHPTPVVRGVVVSLLYVSVVLFAYVLMRWYDRPVRAWLSKRMLHHTGASGESFTAPSAGAVFAPDRPLLQPAVPPDR
jgi:peptidoglycan/LPS O-acetylase OafA/YrhL